MLFHEWGQGRWRRFPTHAPAGLSRDMNALLDLTENFERDGVVFGGGGYGIGGNLFAHGHRI
jgi:hypothetical protein